MSARSCIIECCLAELKRKGFAGSSCPGGARTGGSGTSILRRVEMNDAAASEGMRLAMDGFCMLRFWRECSSWSCGSAEVGRKHRVGHPDI